MPEGIVVMVGGGQQEVPAVRMVQEAGFKVAVTDRNPLAPAFGGADFPIVADGMNVERVASEVLRLAGYGYEIAYIFTLTELTTTVACVAQMLGLPAASPRAAVMARDKLLAKRRWRDMGIPTPRFRVLHGWPDHGYGWYASRLGERLFVKPAISSGGQGAGLVTDEASWEEVLKRAQPHWGAVLIEEYLEGVHCDVHGMMTKRGLHLLGNAERQFVYGKAMEIGLRIPITCASTIGLCEMVSRSARALGVTRGPVKADVIWTQDKKWKILELAPRLHGPRLSLVALPLSGIDVIKEMLCQVQGELIAINVREAPTAVVGRAVHAEAGTVLWVSGTEEARRMAGIEHVEMYVKSGDVIRNEDNTDIAGYVFATGDSFGECEWVLDEAIDKIRVEVAT